MPNVYDENRLTTAPSLVQQQYRQHLTVLGELKNLASAVPGVFVSAPGDLRLLTFTSNRLLCLFQYGANPSDKDCPLSALFPQAII